ncbi:hypothetical protein ACHAXR_000213, partial [Thalassiosira sp. AJA248-18]
VRYEAVASATGVFNCPVASCVGEADTKWKLRRHFYDRHPLDETTICREGTKRRVQREAAVSAAQSLDLVFTAYDVELEKVKVFKYLGRLLAYDDNDMRAVRINIKKARKSWRILPRLLRAESISPQVCGMFYKAVVLAILLFGSEIWALTPSAMKCLEGLHIRVAYRMARVNRPRK